MAGQEILAVILAAMGVVAVGFALFHAIGVSLNHQKPETLSKASAWLVAPELFLKARGDYHLKRLVIWILILVPCALVFAILTT